MNFLAKSISAVVFAVSLPMAGQMAIAPQAATIFGVPSVNQQAPNTLLLGSGTGISYDSNALNTQPHTSGVQYTFYPLIGLQLSRPQWEAVLSIAPGLAYSSANLPQYQLLSLTSSAGLSYQATERLSFKFSNNYISSSNPFASLITNSTSGQGSNSTGTTAVNYMPKTNELLVADVAYSLSARTSLLASASYNYIDYQHNNDIPDSAQPFQTSTSTKASMGFSYSVSPRHSASVQYVSQFLSAGHGLVKTIGQSLQYSFVYAPSSGLKVSGMIGPEYVGNRYAIAATNTNIASMLKENSSVWTWTGSLAVSEVAGKNEYSANASTQLSTGAQYQGNVQETTLGADFKRRLAGQTDLVAFGSYNINTPVFLTRLAPRLSNNYASTGITLSKTIADHWVVSCAYWYLFQNSPQNGQQLYSGDHNRVAISLSYFLTRALPQ